MGAAFNSRDHRHTYVNDVLHNLNALIMNLAPNAGIGNITEGRKIETGDEFAAGSGQDHDLIRAILRDAVESIDELGVILRRKGEWAAVGMKLGDQHAFGISRQFEAGVCIQVNISKCLRDILLCVFSTTLGSR